MSASQIDIIPSHKINKQKWDDCINKSSNALIYATSVYLDNMTVNWHGIIVNDYDCVMPVPWKRKFGLKYTYDVAFIQQLGWFSRIEFKDQNLLYEVLFSFIKYGDYTFNFNNTLHKDFKTTEHKNYLLDFSNGYENIKNNFSADVQTNVRNASKNDLFYVVADVHEPIDLFVQLYKKKLQHISEEDYKNFKNLTITLSKNSKAFARKVVNKTGEILSEILVFEEGNRLYNIMNSTIAEGKKKDANYFLLTELWKEFEHKRMLFDFEGSDIPGIEKFYKKFGAKLQPYSRIYFNKFSFPLSLVKMPP